MRGHGVGYPPVRLVDDMLLWLLLVLAGVALAVGAFMWSVGEVAGLLFGGGRPGLGLLEAPAVLPRLAAHLSDPAAAWPPEGRRRLPGPVGMYAALGLVILVLMAAGVAAGALWRRALSEAADRRERQLAAWARPRDLGPLSVKAPEAGRLTLGRAGRRLLAAEPRQSLLVVAPTQAGKTTGLVVPAILEWKGPVLATSVKRDLLDDTIARRRALGGKVWVFDPSGVVADADERASWTPLAGCENWAGARRTAAALCAAAQGDRGALRESAFWYEQAASLLAPALLAARAGGASMGDVVSWLSRIDEIGVAERLAQMDCPAAEDAWESVILLEERAKSSVYMTARAVLGAYADPEVAFWADQDAASMSTTCSTGARTRCTCARRCTSRRGSRRSSWP